MRHELQLLTVVVLVIGATVGIAQPVAADDGYPESCNGAPVLTDGTYSDNLSPKDVDTFKLDLSEGDFVTITLQRENPDRYDRSVPIEFDITPYNDTRYDNGEREAEWEKTWSYTEPISPYGSTDGDPGLKYDTGEKQKQFKIFREGGDGPLCLPMTSTDDDKYFRWSMSLAYNDGNPPELTSPERVSQLKSTIERKNERIGELNATIEAQEERIATLESRLNATQKQIEVEIRPEQNRSFHVGGTAVISASASATTLDNLSVQFDERSQVVGADGNAKFSLQQAGDQTLTLSYRDAVETVEINVDAVDTADDNRGDTTEADGDPDSTPGGSGPGFGVGLALLAVFTTVVARHHRT